jgi:sec-independent protein translocase protein TatC
MTLFPKKNKVVNGEEKEMGFFDHLEELRWHILRSVLGILVFGIFFFSNKGLTFDTIIFGPKKADFATYRFFCWLSEATCFYPPQFQLITREFGEQFSVHISVSFWLGLVAAFPYVFYEFWSFVKPGLYENERKVAKGIVFYCSSLFILGVVFGYYVIAPFAITWLGGYSVGLEATNSPTLASYVTYLTMFTIPTGIIFELPIVAYMLAKIGIVSSSFMINFRKHAFVVIFIIAAIVTPPDVVTQILISLPVILLYEFSILVVKGIEKKKSTELQTIEQ